MQVPYEIAEATATINVVVCAILAIVYHLIPSKLLEGLLNRHLAGKDKLCNLLIALTLIPTLAQIAYSLPLAGIILNWEVFQYYDFERPPSYYWAATIVALGSCKIWLTFAEIFWAVGSGPVQYTRGLMFSRWKSAN